MTANEREIRKTVIINALPQVVFRAITEEKELTNWFPDVAILEPRVGGRVKFTFYKEKSEMRDRDYNPEGVVLEYIPNEKISYTWEHKDIPGFPRTVVTWKLERFDENKTRLELVHSGFAIEEQETYDEHNKGWSYFTNKLVEYCASKNNNTTRTSSH